MHDTDRVHRQPPTLPPLRRRTPPVIVDHAFFDRTPTTAPSLVPTPALEDAATTPFPRFAKGTLAPVEQPDPIRREVGLRHARLELPLPLPVKLIGPPRRWGRVISLNRPASRTLRPTRARAGTAAVIESSAGPLAFAVLTSLSLVLLWLYWLLP